MVSYGKMTVNDIVPMSKKKNPAVKVLKCSLFAGERGKRENMKRGKKDALIAGVTVLEQR
jgi:hypothetical protein